MKVLFLSSHLAEQPMGAKTLAKSHYELLCNEYGKDNVVLVSLKAYFYDDANDDYGSILSLNSRLEGIINILAGRPLLINRKTQKYILEKCSECDAVFVDNYSFGNLTKTIKKKLRIPVISFFHGIYIVEGNAWRRNKKNSIGSTVIYLELLKNEKNTVKYSDKIIVLNKRDAGELYEHYNKNPDLILPMMISDRANIVEKTCDSNVFNILFVGGLFGPNVEGITWFVKNVIPRLNKVYNLYIVGNKMETLRNQDVFKAEQVHVVGSVDDLGVWYNDANVVIGPIFSGDGMKTKTAEALMYGKIYLGTTEALCGYDYLNDFLCNTADEFINKIQEIKENQVSKYCNNMRNIYLENYSTNAMQKKVSKLLNSSVEEYRTV